MMRRRIRAMIVAKFAIVAEIGDVRLIFGGQAVRFSGSIVDSDKHLVKGGTEIETAAASVADVGDPGEFFAERSFILCDKAERVRTQRRSFLKHGDRGGWASTLSPVGDRYFPLIDSSAF